MSIYRVAVFACRLSLLVFFSIDFVHAQVLVSATVCAVMHNPAPFAGHIVKLRATVASGFESSTIVDPNESSCRGPWFDDAPKKSEQRPRGDGYDAELQRLHPVFLVEDENMKRFNDALRAVVYPRENKVVFLGGNPRRYKVTATMTGRVDDAGTDRLGFGHMNAYRVRFMLSSVQDVTTEELPYNWAEFSRNPVRFPHGTIRGKVTDALGRPIKSAWVEAIPAEGEVPISGPEVLTEKDGSYSLDVEPRKYFVVVSRTEPASESVPLLTTYFPAAETEAGATTLDISDDSDLTDIDIHVRRTLTPRSFEVQVLGPNDEPAIGAYAFLTQTNQAPIVGGGVTHANADGKVRLMGFEGLDYLLWADLGSGPSERCAQVVHLDPNQAAAVPIVIKIMLTHAACSKQADEARSAAYASQKR